MSVQTTIVPRQSNDETTFAVVRFSGVPLNELQNAVKAALKDWQTTPEGADALADTNPDFNIGDLAQFNTADLNPLPGTLVFHLQKQGITLLDIDVYSEDGTGGWEFDDPLLPED